MGDYIHRSLDALFGSALLPAGLRGHLMRLYGFRLAPSVCIWSGGSFKSKRIEIGSNVFINIGFFYDGADYAVIEDNVRIGQFVRLITASHDIGPSEQRCLVTAVTQPIRVKKGCWIGAGVMILPGVTIAGGCVVAAGSVVTKSTRSDGLYAGVPARRIRDLDGEAALDFNEDARRSDRFRASAIHAR